MKAISLRPEWAMPVALGIKTVECRTWGTGYRGDLLVCSSSRKVDGLVSGHALCVVELVAVEPFGDRHRNGALVGALDDLADGTLAWCLGNVRMVRPFPVKGKLHLFDVSDDSVEVVGKPSRSLVEKYYLPLVHRCRGSEADLMWMETFGILGW